MKRARCTIAASSALTFMGAALGAAGLSSCAVDGVGGSVGIGYVGGYYEPYGYDYGGWGPGYAVGPYRGGHGDFHHDRGHAPAFRPPAPHHPMPSLPHPRGR
jgi:hypothetical protein